MPIPTEAEYELDEFPIMIAGIEVGCVNGSAFLQMDSAGVVVTTLRIDGVEHYDETTEVGIIAKTRPKLLVLKRVEPFSDNAWIFKNIAGQIKNDPEMVTWFIEETTA